MGVQSKLTPILIGVHVLPPTELINGNGWNDVVYLLSRFASNMELVCCPIILGGGLQHCTGWDGQPII